MFCRTQLGLIALVGLSLFVTGCPGQPHRHPVVPQLPPPQTPTPSPRPSQVPPPSPWSRPKSLSGTKVVVDPGHGGKDPGTRGVSALPEKNVVLAVGNELARVLRQRGASVISTRTTDRFLELDDRAAIAQRNRVSLFISVHADAAQRRGASGATVYVGRNASSQSRAAARAIDAALRAAGIETRGVENANYRVLVAHSRPAVLVECGYMTNITDARRLNTAAYRSRLAAAIANGVANYMGH
jgi:N-acetylmuramoyl-L-alanine amidase